MVVACKDYITDKGVHRIWDFSHDVISKRIQDALDLYNEYDSGFQAMKNKSEKEFDFSEMYTFGKFVSFCKRLEKVGLLYSRLKPFHKPCCSCTWTGEFFNSVQS